MTGSGCPHGQFSAGCAVRNRLHETGWPTRWIFTGASRVGSGWVPPRGVRPIGGPTPDRIFVGASRCGKRVVNPHMRCALCATADKIRVANPISFCGTSRYGKRWGDRKANVVIALSRPRYKIVAPLSGARRETALRRIKRSPVGDGEVLSSVVKVERTPRPARAQESGTIAKCRFPCGNPSKCRFAVITLANAVSPQETLANAVSPL
jgi:hypothetical protein